jgi:hypothetical protein
MAYVIEHKSEALNSHPGTTPPPPTAKKKESSKNLDLFSSEDRTGCGMGSRMTYLGLRNWMRKPAGRSDREGTQLLGYPSADVKTSELSAQWNSTCLACIRLWAPSSAPQHWKERKKRRQEREVLNIKLWFRVCSRKNGRRQNINSYKNFFCKLPEKQGCD